MVSPRHITALALVLPLALSVASPAWSATPGPAYSWGDNANGRLGTAQSPSVDDSVPTAMAAPFELGLISAGWNHGCGLAAGGAAWCWGYNGSGRLGNGTTTESSTPVAVADGFAYNNIDSGRDSTCAVLEGDDTIYCWGQNDSGQLGDGTTTDDSTPVQVVESPHPLTSIDSVSAGGSSACAVANDDTAYCWGNNAYGHLGNGGMPTDSSVPVPVSGAYRFVEVSVGEEFACGVTRASGASGPGVCWGDNTEGQLGKGTTSVTSDDSVPRPIVGGLTLTSIASGAGHACAISIDDSVYCWGRNGNGQLGIGSTDDTSVPSRVAIPGGVAVRDVSAGSESTCAVTDDSAYCWGSGSAGQLGIGSTIDSTTPVAVTLAGIDSQNSPVQVTSGEGYNAFIVKPRMTFPAGTAFPSVQAGQTASTTVYARNNRTGPMTFTSTTVSGSGVSITDDSCTGLTISSGSYCTVAVAWNPAAAGALSSSLTFNYLGNSSTTALTGTATAAPTPAAPSPPRDVTAVAADASATVTWTAPSDPGSFPVSNYAVTASPGGKTCLTSTLTCQVIGLTNGTTYTFIVKALNGAGWSAASAPSNAVTPKATAKPSILITGSRDGSTIRVEGTTTGLAGTVTPWTKFPGQTRYTEGSARPAITDNAFTWSRKANKRTYVYFTHSVIKSNTVTIGARQGD